MASVSAERSASPATGSRPWKCTTAAPASTHRDASLAISSGDHGTFGFTPRMAASFMRTVMITVPTWTPVAFAGALPDQRGRPDGHRLAISSRLSGDERTDLVYGRRVSGPGRGEGGTMDVQRLKARDPVSDISDALLADGAVIVEGLLDDDLLARFNTELDPLLAAARPDHGRYVNDTIAGFFGDRTRHVLGMGGKSRVFATEILPNPVYLGVCDAVLLPNCARYRLNLAHVMDRGPGSVRQWPHRDELVWNHIPTPHPEVQVASVIALVDFTADNGATVLAPGSHRWDADRQPTEDEFVAAEMPAGSAVIYLGSTIHAGGSNTTEGWRRGMHLSYCLGWLRTEENQFLATPLEIARTLPRQSQELLGYAAHDAIATRRRLPRHGRGAGPGGAHRVGRPRRVSPIDAGAPRQ